MANEHRDKAGVFRRPGGSVLHIYIPDAVLIGKLRHSTRSVGTDFAALCKQHAWDTSRAKVVWYDGELPPSDSAEWCATCVGKALEHGGMLHVAVDMAKGHLQAILRP